MGKRRTVALDAESRKMFRHLTRSQSRREQELVATTTATAAPPPAVPTTVATPAPPPIVPTATEAPPSSPTFVSTLVAHEELFSDPLVGLLSADDLANLCDALGGNRLGRRLLENEPLWQYATTRDGVAGATVVTPTVTSPVGCDVLNEYLSRRNQFERFQSCVTVLAEDIGTVTSVDGVRVDCLAFPTSSAFYNPGIGAAGCVHHRIGAELNHQIPQEIAQGGNRNVLATPGAAGIKLVVHCVGPSGTSRNRRVQLYNTYSKAISEIERVPYVHCAAFASISTGTLRYPKREAAEVAMLAVRDAFRTRRWPLDKKIAFVCIDKELLKAFQDARALTLSTFFTSNATFPPQVQPIQGA